MKLCFIEEVGYLLKASLIHYRNAKMFEVSRLERLSHEQSYADISKLNWEITQLNKLIDNYDKAICAVFCK